MSKRAKHQSAGPELDRSIRWLESLATVKKIVLGFTENCRHKYKPGTIRAKLTTDGGFHAIGYQGNGITNLFIVVDPQNVDNIKQLIKERFK